jgi:lipoate-protein ligase A
LKLVCNSDCTDPAYNLALEEYCVRNLDLSSEQYLLIYINNPCVVIGKHQNVFAECNTSYLRQKSVPIIRRISGGGAVYHDRGNINFSYIRKFSDREINNYSEFTRPVLKTLFDVGVNCRLNERNNILIGDKKISGNAQFSNMRVMFSHGTLLFESDLDEIKRSLRVKEQLIESKHVKSVISNVTNIREHVSVEIDLMSFLTMLKKNILGNSYDEFRLSEVIKREVELLAKTKYRSSTWNYLACPDFKMMRNFHSGNIGIKYFVAVEKGIVREMSFETSDGRFINFEKMIGIEYLYDNIVTLFSTDNPVNGISAVELADKVY